MIETETPGEPERQGKKREKHPVVPDTEAKNRENVLSPGAIFFTPEKNDGIAERLNWVCLKTHLLTVDKRSAD
jgi:hypothetical protein